MTDVGGDVKVFLSSNCSACVRFYSAFGEESASVNKLDRERCLIPVDGSDR